MKIKVNFYLSIYINEMHKKKKKVTYCSLLYKEDNKSKLIQFISISLYLYNYYFLLPTSRERIFFRSNYRSGDFDGFTRFEVS